MSNGKHCLNYCKDVEKYGLKALPIQNDCVLIKAKESTIQSRLHLGFSQCSYKQICTKYGLGEAEELKENIGQYWSPRRKHIQGVKNQIITNVKSKSRIFS